MTCRSCGSLGASRKTVVRYYNRGRLRGLCRGLGADCYDGAPGVIDPPCRTCGSSTPNQVRGLGEAKAPSAVRKFLECLSNEIGGAAFQTWTPETHAIFHEQTRSYLTFHAEGETAATYAARPFGKYPWAEGTLVANFPTRILTPESAFWTCIGFTMEEARASVAERGGDYWNLINAVSKYVYLKESGREVFRLPSPSILASLIVGGLGVGAAFLAVR